MRDSVNFFESTEHITRSLARLTATMHALVRRLNRDDAALRVGRYLRRATRRVATQSATLQHRARAFAEAVDGVIAWFRGRHADDRTARFALVSFRQIAATALDRHRAFRETIATAPAMVEHFAAARKALLAGLDGSIEAMQRTLSASIAVAEALEKDQ